MEVDSSVSTNCERSIPKTRFPRGLWTIFLLPYLPIGVVLYLLRVCMSLQAILILLIIPEGSMKRLMLRVFFSVLGIVVTTEGHISNTKLLISNKVSLIDHIVLHLAANCVTVSVGSKAPPLATLFSHCLFPASGDDALLSAAKALPVFDDNEATVDYDPYVVQPEPLPTNGRHAILEFSVWPFSLDSVVQPLALSVFRPFPVSVTTAWSSGWWDLFWMLFLPMTLFHVRFLPILDSKSTESPDQFAGRVQEIISTSLNLQAELKEEEIKKWLSAPPPPPPPLPPQKTPNGPIISPSEFDPSTHQRSSSELETKVYQVTAVLPQVPHTVIRRDLLRTNSVDVTITNLLEGRVKYDSISSSSVPATRSMPASQVFRRKVASSSAQRHLSLEERKKELVENARRRYMEKHQI